MMLLIVPFKSGKIKVFFWRQVFLLAYEMGKFGITINIQIAVLLMVVGHFWTPALSLRSRGATFEVMFRRTVGGVLGKPLGVS
jgi:hypothetical protein